MRREWGCPGFLLAAGLLAALPLPVKAAPDARKAAREAAYLEDAFSHDLCTRDDRALRRLTRALGKRATAAAH